MEIRYGRGDWPGVECLRLTREHLTPVCAPAIARALASPGDLAGHTLLHAVGFETGWPQWLGAAGAADILERTTALLADTTATVLELAAHGSGIAMGRSGFIDALLTEGRLQAPFDLCLDTDEAFFLVRLPGGEARTDAAAFWDWMAGQAA
ncbi:MAG: LysR substrate-binding domain-containing protein [Halofilum sp. (in: g-proteobacteria)]|nr:LysR substrate-binding domain-containing protein [Halofilum sp. (in: g-proteobacteria)]